MAKSQTFRLKELRAIRWVEAFGQLVIFLSAIFFLKLPISPTPFVIIFTLIVISNGVLYLHAIRALAASQGGLGVILSIDTALLATLLYFYGGHANPFSMFFLVHIVLAAALLNTAWTWGLVIFSSVSFALLFFYNVPIAALSGDMHHGHHAYGDDLAFDLHLQGMLISFVIIGVLIATFVSRIRNALRQSESELREAQRSEEMLAALTNLAAGAAHELRTPLATISLISDELRALTSSRSDQVSSEISKELTELDRQVGKCSQIISKLGTKSGLVEGEQPSRLAIVDLARRISESHPDRVEVHTLIGDSRELIIPVETILSALGSLIKNALDFSPQDTQVKVEISDADKMVKFRVIDRGAGIPPELIERIGTPFFTTRETGKGMGLGVFLVRLVAKRVGGSFEINSEVGKGTAVSISIPEQCVWA